jgi:hypothetical protein
MAGDEGEAAGEWRSAEPVAAGAEREGEPAAESGLADGSGQPAATGEPRVDAALARLDELAGLPVTEHARVFDDVHRQLEDVLGELSAGAAGEPD